ncbi:Transposon Ty3-G Gag-Pol poly [Brachionus plicatilis]|uniref:Transposon Ty3-G Gag-Pol poly n=1 Tax=Brachionus plicatilis TaxID=10195 RepID=A0A3M7SDJ9_BRAPC|nr:Transposon Ty3-G Gag-Pol poly [Brachionus plicatilis]
MKLNYDLNVTAAKLKVGDLVWVHNDVVKKGQCKKFTFSWTGPYVVESVFNNVNYKMRSLNSKRKRLIVHRNRLKRHFGKHEIETENSLATQSNNEKNKRVNLKTLAAKKIVERAKVTLQERQNPMTTTESGGSSDDETFVPNAATKRLLRNVQRRAHESIRVKRDRRPPQLPCTIAKIQIYTSFVNTLKIDI